MTSSGIAEVSLYILFKSFYKVFAFEEYESNPDPIGLKANTKTSSSFKIGIRGGYNNVSIMWFALGF